MKRGTPSHPKVANFAEYLGVRLPYAIGYLELLFHFTAQYCPRGDIGRYSDKRIAAGIMYLGRPEKLIDALLKAGLIEPHPSSRLVVHDWHVHCDDATRRRVERADESFLSDTGKVAEQSSECSRTATAIAKPDDFFVVGTSSSLDISSQEFSLRGDVQTVQETTRARGANGQPGIRTSEQWFTEFWSVVWAKIGRGSALAAFRKVATTAEKAARITEAAKVQGPLLKAHAANNGHSVLHPATWLNQQRWEDDIGDLSQDISRRSPATQMRNTATEAAARMWLNTRRGK